MKIAIKDTELPPGIYYNFQDIINFTFIMYSYIVQRLLLFSENICFFLQNKVNKPDFTLLCKHKFIVILPGYYPVHLYKYYYLLRRAVFFFEIFTVPKTVFRKM